MYRICLRECNQIIASNSPHIACGILWSVTVCVFVCMQANGRANKPIIKDTSHALCIRLCTMLAKRVRRQCLHKGISHQSPSLLFCLLYGKPSNVVAYGVRPRVRYVEVCNANVCGAREYGHRNYLTHTIYKYIYDYIHIMTRDNNLCLCCYCWCCWRYRSVSFSLCADCWGYRIWRLTCFRYISLYYF